MNQDMSLMDKPDFISSFVKYSFLFTIGFFNSAEPVWRDDGEEPLAHVVWLTLDDQCPFCAGMSMTAFLDTLTGSIPGTCLSCGCQSWGSACRSADWLKFGT
jgi:hypothetical protein